MEQLGLLNSRMKDYFDLWVLARHYAFDGELLRQAIRNTFRRRKTDLPAGEPEGLSTVFATDPNKNAQWAGFVRRARLRESQGDLKDLIGLLREFIMPVVKAAQQQEEFASHWPAGGPWRPAASASWG